MNLRSVSLASSIVRVWTRCYTWGMPAAVRDARRAEIESDLWEFQREARDRGALGHAAHVLVRLIIGIKDDVLWRAGHSTLSPIAIRNVAIVGMAVLVVGVVWISSVLDGPELPRPAAAPIQWKRRPGPAPPPPPPPPPPCLPPALGGCRP
jgi:hypothetical protein